MDIVGLNTRADEIKSPCQQVADVLLRKEQQIKVSILKKRLQIISERLVGPNLIHNILVRSVSDTSRGTRRK